MEEKTLTEKESLELISQMILNTKQKLRSGSGKPFLIWGYTTFMVSLLIYYLINKTEDYHYHWLWFLIPIIGFVGNYLSRKKRQKHSKNYIDRVISYVWIVIGISGFLISFATIFVRMPALSMEVLLMGIGTTLTGLILKFKPIIISGFFAIASCYIFFFIKGSEEIIIFGFIFLIMMVIPGHILNYQQRRRHV